MPSSVDMHIHIRHSEQKSLWISKHWSRIKSRTKATGYICCEPLEDNGSSGCTIWYMDL